MLNVSNNKCQNLSFLPLFLYYFVDMFVKKLLVSHRLCIFYFINICLRNDCCLKSWIYSCYLLFYNILGLQDLVVYCLHKYITVKTFCYFSFLNWFIPFKNEHFGLYRIIFFGWLNVSPERLVFNDWFVLTVFYLMGRWDQGSPEILIFCFQKHMPLKTSCTPC